MRTTAQALNALGEDAAKVPDNYSATRSFHALVRRLVKEDFTEERLEFDLLLFGAEGPWKAPLCDFAHVNPGTWQLEYFQKVLYGADAPSGSLVSDASAMTVQTLPVLLDRHPRLADAYSFIRQKLPPRSFNEEAKRALAQKIPLADALWFYEELHCTASASAIEQRLESGECLCGKSNANFFGKLVERLLLFRRLGVTFWPRLLPHAEALLAELKARRQEAAAPGVVLPLQALAAEAAAAAGTLEEAPETVVQSASDSCAACGMKLRVAVLGDASSSMQVAVEAATIFAGMASAVFDADLVFFHSKAFRATSVDGGAPKSVTQVLHVTEEVRANGTTSMAAALHEYYARKEAIDLFILVSDEGENTSGPSGDRFVPLWQKYLAEVNPCARLVFVSFLNDSNEGSILHGFKALSHASGVHVPTQFRFDPQRPDLSKFDALLRKIQLEHATAAQQAAAATSKGSGDEDGEDSRVDWVVDVS